MPRGVAIPEIRQQLFSAAERVIVRDGPDKLSSRAVTGEAGVATGLLYAHFADLDDFLAAYAIDRSFLVSSAAAALPERAGTGSVAENLCEAALSTAPAAVLALTRILVSRPQLAGHIRRVLGDRTAGLDALEGAATAYLADEQRLGRLAGTIEPSVLALALVGVLQRLMVTADPGSDLSARVRQTVTALVNSFTAAAPPVDQRGGAAVRRP